MADPFCLQEKKKKDALPTRLIGVACVWERDRRKHVRSRIATSKRVLLLIVGVCGCVCVFYLLLLMTTLWLALKYTLPSLFFSPVVLMLYIKKKKMEKGTIR